MFGLIQLHKNSAGAAAAAAIVAAGLVTAPPEPSDTVVIKTAAVAVQLQAVVTRIAALAVTEPTPSDSGTTSSPEPFPITTVTDPLPPAVRQILKLITAPVGLILAPIWYLGFPVTYPLFASVSGMGGYGTSEFALFAWALAPFNLDTLLVPLQTTTTYSSAASRAVGAASERANSDAAVTVAAVVQSVESASPLTTGEPGSSANGPAPLAEPARATARQEIPTRSRRIETPASVRPSAATAISAAKYATGVETSPAAASAPVGQAKRRAARDTRTANRPSASAATGTTPGGDASAS